VATDPDQRADPAPSDLTPPVEPVGPGEPVGLEEPREDEPEAPGRVARLRNYAEDVADRTVMSLRVARGRSKLVDAVWSTGEHDRRAVGSVLAGAVAFRLFVYLLPLFLAMLTLVGLVVGGFDDDAVRDAGDNLGMSSYIIDSVVSAGEQSQRTLWWLVPLALWAIYSAGASTVRVLHAIHALAWSQPPSRLRNTPAAAGAAFLVAAATVALVALSQWAREVSPGVGLGAVLVEILPLSALWFVVSSRLPRDPRAPWTALIPGALLVGVGMWLTHLVSVYYLARRIDHASELYGSLGVAAAILAWLYLIGRLMVASAMLNSTLWERRTGRLNPAPSDSSGPPVPPAPPSG
jgi:uncharacterized BrkB/YihY/UPF0761 family membrane protein